MKSEMEEFRRKLEICGHTQSERVAALELNSAAVKDQLAALGTLFTEATLPRATGTPVSLLEGLSSLPLSLSTPPPPLHQPLPPNAPTGSPDQDSVRIVDPYCIVLKGPKQLDALQVLPALQRHTTITRLTIHPGWNQNHIFVRVADPFAARALLSNQPAWIPDGFTAEECEVRPRRSNQRR